MPRIANARRKTAADPARDQRAPRRTSQTRHRIVEAAGQVFAEKGYHAATGKEICERAAVNGAAINYHFGGMDALYQEVLRVAFEQLVALDLFERVAADQPTPEDRLLALYRLMVQGFVDGSGRSWQWRVVSREAIAPSPEMEEARLSLLVPKMRMFRNLVSDLLRLPPDHPAVAQGCLSIIAPVVLMQVGAWPAIERAFDGFTIDAGNAADIAQQFFTFTQAGLRAVAEHHQGRAD